MTASVGSARHLPASAGAATPFVIPAIAAAATGMRLQLMVGITPALIIAVLLLPVWWPAVRGYRFARGLIFTGLAAVVWGAVVTLTDTTRYTTTSLLLSESMVPLSMLGGLGLLLWARSCIGDSWTLIAFTMGMFVNIGIAGGNPINLWKFTFSFPVAFLLLGIAMRFNKWWEIIVLVVIAGVSAVSDSRSFTSFALAAAVLVLFQLRPGQASRPRPWQTLLGLAGIGLALATLMQALLLDGVLGEAAAQRSAAQISASGSLITGGRPELGAALALIWRQPWGYGSGTLPSSADVLVAKTGMTELNYDPNNGYVERYMFGTQYEVHSVLGDLWIRFGPLGAAFGIALLALAIYAVAMRVSLRTASGALALLVTLGIWDTFFSPLLTSYNTIALLFALSAIVIPPPGQSAPSLAPSALRRDHRPRPHHPRPA